MVSTVEDSTRSILGHELRPCVSERTPAGVLLNEEVIGDGAIQMVRRWWSGILPGRGKIIQQGLSGASETVVEEERFRSLHTFDVT